MEKRKSDLSVEIIKEEMAKPMLTKEQIVFWFHRFRKLNTRRLDHKRRLIDSFVNAVYLYDDKMVITFNYKDGSKTVSLTEVENSNMSSDLTASALPKRKYVRKDVLPLFFYNEGLEQQRPETLFRIKNTLFKSSLHLLEIIRIS